METYKSIQEDKLAKVKLVLQASPKGLSWAELALFAQESQKVSDLALKKRLALWVETGQVKFSLGVYKWVGEING